MKDADGHVPTPEDVGARETHCGAAIAQTQAMGMSPIMGTDAPAVLPLDLSGFVS